MERRIISRTLIVAVMTVIGSRLAPGVTSEESRSYFVEMTQAIPATCTYDNDCTNNAYCNKQETCHCMRGFVLNRNDTTMECLKIASKIGDPCIHGIQCKVTLTAQAECRNNVCSCSEGSHYEPDPKRCYESKELGEVCRTSYDCHLKSRAPSFCIKSVCSCPAQYHTHGKDCIKSAFIGDQCSIHEECHILYSWCTGNCTCEPNYVLSSDRNSCLKVAKAIGDPCIEDVQCKASLRNTKCGDNNTCTCMMNFRQPGATCMRKMNPQMLGKKCHHWGQCVLPTIPETIPDDSEITNVDCLRGMCSCAEGYALTEPFKDCIRFSDNGAPKTGDPSFLVLFFFSIYIYVATQD